MHLTARALGAEALGTLFLVATVVGSGIMGERLADGNIAIALLANTLATGAILFVLITWLGPVSGAHFNPAVTLAFVCLRRFPAIAFVPYLVAQVAGGLSGTVLAHLMFELPPVMLSAHARTGGAQWLSEGVATFGLLATILGCLKVRPSAVPAAVGAYIAAAYWFTASTSFANPAVTIARAVTDSFSGIRPADVPFFMLAQIGGALAAAFVLSWMMRAVDGDGANPAGRPQA
ncbi:MAG: aquaporin family protein [Alphaproteobacteria bacterium]|nr:aquaporin family protein [Alphaproteobacteria bacterium]